MQIDLYATRDIGDGDPSPDDITATLQPRYDFGISCKFVDRRAYRSIAIETDALRTTLEICEDVAAICRSGQMRRMGTRADLSDPAQGSAIGLEGLGLKPIGAESVCIDLPGD